MRNTAFFAAGFGLLLVQAQLFRVLGLVHLPGAVPSLVLPLILFMGVHEYSLARGAGVAFVLGYATDLIGIAPVGLYTFTYVALFLLARGAGVRLAAQTTWMQVVLALAFTLVHFVHAVGADTLTALVIFLKCVKGRRRLHLWFRPKDLFSLFLPQRRRVGNRRQRFLIKRRVRDEDPLVQVVP